MRSFVIGVFNGYDKIKGENYDGTFMYGTDEKLMKNFSLNI